MPKCQVEILLAAWQDIDKISDFHLKWLALLPREKLRTTSWTRWPSSLPFPIWVPSTLTRSWLDWNIARSSAEIMSAYTR